MSNEILIAHASYRAALGMEAWQIANQLGQLNTEQKTLIRDTVRAVKLGRRA